MWGDVGTSQNGARVNQIWYVLDPFSAVVFLQFRERRAIEMLTVRTCQYKRNIVDVFATCDIPHRILANPESQLCGI